MRVGEEARADASWQVNAGGGVLGAQESQRPEGSAGDGFLSSSFDFVEAFEIVLTPRSEGCEGSLS